MDQKKRFCFAMGLYAVLALLIWLTMDSGVVTIRRESGAIIEIPFRNVAFGILGLFAALTVLRWRSEQRESRREQDRVQE
jgi:ABC-type transport system involved in cytochrome c biogenesis permease subunit